jgi:large subunit ribosomal protein L32
MAHPKRRISTTRRDKRRSHDFGTPKTITTDPTTGEIHLRHRAHVFEET